MGEKSTLVDFFSIECRKFRFFWGKTHYKKKRILEKHRRSINILKWGFASPSLMKYLISGYYWRTKLESSITFRMSSSFVCVERLWLSFKYSCNAAEKNKKSLGNNNQKWPFLHSINPKLQSAVLMLKKEAQTRGKNLLFHAGNFFSSRSSWSK